MAEVHNDDDTERLYAAATHGDPAAFDKLLERYLPRLHAFVHARLGPELRQRESSLDVVQSVCRQLVAARDRFDFRDEKRFRAWLFTSALNKIREKNRFHRLGLRDMAREDADGSRVWQSVGHLLTPSQEAIGHETAAALEEALAALSADHREVIALSRLAELPHRVIAEKMGRSEPAVRQLLGRALVQFATELQARGVRPGGSTAP